VVLVVGGAGGGGGGGRAGGVGWDERKGRRCSEGQLLPTSTMGDTRSRQHTSDTARHCFPQVAPTDLLLEIEATRLAHRLVARSGEYAQTGRGRGTAASRIADTSAPLDATPPTQTGGSKDCLIPDCSEVDAAAR